MQIILGRGRRWEANTAIPNEPTERIAETRRGRGKIVSRSNAKEDKTGTHSWNIVAQQDQSCIFYGSD